jgi:hypothetical protein
MAGGNAERGQAHAPGLEPDSADRTQNTRPPATCSICHEPIYRHGVCRRCWEYELGGGDEA